MQLRSQGNVLDQLTQSSPVLSRHKMGSSVKSSSGDTRKSPPYAECSSPWTRFDFIIESITGDSGTTKDRDTFHLP